VLEVRRGTAAEHLLAAPAFQSHWRALGAACPWGTMYQDVPFVTIWYACYRDEFEPLVVSDADDAGVLRGLLFLAVSRASGRIVPCGMAQAEYDAWLATPDHGMAFIEAACEALSGPFPHGRIAFLFLPPNAPQAFSAAWRTRCFIRPFSRPLHSTAPGCGEAQASLKKKGNKSKLNQLQRQGDLNFERVTEPQAFDALLEEMIPLFDARQTTLNGAPPFGADPQRRGFFREMFRQDLLHVTAMRVGGRLAAAHIGHINRGQVVLGLIAHSPFLAKYSVGKFQMLLLAVELQREGFEAFDLTPAGDYKDRFATHSDQAHALTIFLSRADARQYRVTRALIDFGKRYASTERVKTALTRARHRVGLLRGAGIPGQVAARLAASVWERRETRVYILDAASATARTATTVMRRDAIEDLLCYEPTEPSQPTRADFMRTALERLGAGDHLYSRVEEGRLAQWGWLVDRPETLHVPGIAQTLTLPPGSAVLFDFHAHSAYRGRGFFGQALAQVVAEAGRTPGVEHLVISALATSRAAESEIEEAGFRYWRSLFRTRTFWSTRSVAPDPALSLAAPDPPDPKASGASRGQELTPTSRP
jgi:CelD/BcsL family acetyltransferase involved in cellulose biosynthesis/RimJ/RimL family protein N-acetyltransferase